MFGNGIVIAEDWGEGNISVHFTNSPDGTFIIYHKNGTFQKTCKYKYYMKIDPAIVDPDITIQRTLFHGHDIITKIRMGLVREVGFQLREKCPVRYPWVNVYITKKGHHNIIQGSIISGKIQYKTKELAIKAVKNSDSRMINYLDTIQLKPKIPVIIAP